MEQHQHIIPLVKAASRGESNAQATLYRLYSRAMYSICVRMTGNATDAEDVLQDAFVQGFQQLGHLKNPALFGGWLKRIVINQCIRYSRKTLQTLQWDSNYEEIADDVLEWWQHISPEAINNAIKDLPEGCRQVFILYAMEDFGHKEIAANLQISEGTSKSQYFRAKQLLKKSILKTLHHGSFTAVS